MATIELVRDCQIEEFINRRCPGWSQTLWHWLPVRDEKLKCLEGTEGRGRRVYFQRSIKVSTADIKGGFVPNLCAKCFPPEPHPRKNIR